jgi:hypothetical protein
VRRRLLPRKVGGSAAAKMWVFVGSLASNCRTSG